MDDLISLKDAAKKLNLHPETLRRWDRLGKLTSQKVGSRRDRKYKLSDIQRLISKDLPLGEKTDKTTPYIQPKVKIHDSFERAEEDRRKYGYLYLGNEVINGLNDSIIRSRSIVLAEAGYGKSRLLKEAAHSFRSSGNETFEIDLKLFAQSDLPSIVDYISSKDKKLAGNLPKKSSNLLICLDGLDEITASKFDITVDRVKDFIELYPQLSILVSSRWHFYKKRQQDFNNLELSIITVLPFTTEQIEEFLIQNGISTKDKEKIIEILSTSGRDLIIQTPRYLELLVRYVKENSLIDVSKLRRCDLFDYFIFQRLNLEDERLNAQRRIMFRNILERLSLVMEIYQTNIIEKEDFAIFIEEIASTSTKSLASEDLLDIFFEKSLLIDNGDTIEFENTEFQEYLSAKHLLTIGQSFYKLYDLIVEDRLREIHPSWFSTLSYLIEMDPSYLEPLLSFGKTNKNGIAEDEQYHMLLTKFNLHKLTDSNKIDIFKHVFLYYQNVLNWVSYDIGRNLAYYYIPQLNELLKSFVEKSSYVSDLEKNVQLGNVALLVGSIKKINLFSKDEEEYWKEKLINMIQTEGGNGVLQRHALDALQQYKDEEMIDKVMFLEKHSERLVREQLLEFCIYVNPNNPSSISLFTRSLKENFLMGGYQGLQMLNTKESLLKMIDLLVSDVNTLELFLDRDKSIYGNHKSDKILENLEKVWDEEICNKLEELVSYSFTGDACHTAERSFFISEAVLLIDRKKPGLVFRLLNICKSSTELAENLYYLQNIFSTLLKVGDIKMFSTQISQFERGSYIAVWTLNKIKFLKAENSKAIFEEGRQFFTKEYIELEKAEKKHNNFPNREEETYKDFKFRLMPEKGKYLPDVFDSFNHNQEIIMKLWTPEDKDRLVSLITGSIFDKFDPRGEKITITNIHDGSKTYTINSWIHIFGECIQVAKKIDLDITNYRRKIAGYIPYAAYENLLSEILEMLGDLSEEEVQDVLVAYRSKESDLWMFSPKSLIEVAKLKKLSDARDILKLFVDTTVFDNYERINALEAISIIGQDNKKYFQDVFSIYKNNNMQLAETANNILISKFEDNEAINWRFNQVKLRARPFQRQEGMHEVTELESELDNKAFASPLMALSNIKYESQFLELLNLSFKLLEEDSKYFNYSQYLWRIVHEYFDKRKISGSYEPLELLEKYVIEHGNKSGANWFTTHLIELRKAYLLTIGKPSSFADSVAKYNEVKQRSYLSIASNEDLYQKVKQILMTKIQEFLYSEGISLLVKDESTIQKQLQTELKINFLEEELKVKILRESQALDNTRCDFLIYYGWLGPILIELKLASHPDLGGKSLQSKKSYQRLKQYISNYQAYKGILLVIDNVERSKKAKSSKDHFNIVNNIYGKLPDIGVVWLRLTN